MTGTGEPGTTADLGEERTVGAGEIGKAGGTETIAMRQTSRGRAGKRCVSFGPSAAGVAMSYILNTVTLEFFQITGLLLGTIALLSSVF